MLARALVASALVALGAAVLPAASAAKAPAAPPPATCPRVPIELLDPFTTAHLKVGDEIRFIVLPVLPLGSPENAPLHPASVGSPRGVLRVAEMSGRRTSNRSASVALVIEPLAIDGATVQLTGPDGTPTLKLYGARNGIPSMYTFIPYLGYGASAYDLFHRGKEVAYAAGSTFYAYARTPDLHGCLPIETEPSMRPGTPAPQPTTLSHADATSPLEASVARTS